MELWQEKASEEMVIFIKNFLKIDRINFTGSILDHNSLDIFSDVDADIFLHDDVDFCMSDFICELSNQYSILGYETYSYDNKDVLRICLETGWRFDLSFFYKKKIQTLPVNSTLKDKIQDTVNRFWFLASMVLIKLGRKDFLIASHLALELCQLTIVVQMLVRDEMKNTSIHRFGDMEHVPILHSFNHNGELKDLDTARKIVYILYQATEQMDSMIEELNMGYTRRGCTLKSLQRQLNYSFSS